MESSKVTTRHIKQVASDPKAAQMQSYASPVHTDLPASKHKKKKSFVKCRPPRHKNDTNDRQQVSSYHNNYYTKSFDAKNVYKNNERSQRCGDSHTHWGFPVSSKEISVQVLPQVWTLYKIRLVKMSISCQLVYISWCLMIQSWRHFLLVPSRLVLTQLIQWRLLDLVYSIWSTQTLRNYKKWLCMLHRMMVVSCCPALQHLCLD